MENGEVAYQGPRSWSSGQDQALLEGCCLLHGMCLRGLSMVSTLPNTSSKGGLVLNLPVEIILGIFPGDTPCICNA